MGKLERPLDEMRRLAAGAEPAFIKAHYLVCVLLPRMAAAVGVPEVSKELAALMARGLALHTGVCAVCHRAPAADRDDVCPRCQSQIDQITAEMDAMFDDGGDE